MKASSELNSRRLLVVDDDEVSRNLLAEVLGTEGIQVDLAKSGEEALTCIARTTYPVVLTDMRMLEVDGLTVLRAAKSRDASTVVLLMTGFGSLEGAVEAIQKGALDYVSKPFEMNEIKALVARGFQCWEDLHPSGLASKKEKMRVVVAAEDPSSTARAMVGKTSRMLEVYKTIARASLSSSSVLILGESGTGKELVARAVHAHSPRGRAQDGRPKGAFVAVNCGALAENLLESELFGHVRGAFTGALNDKRGLFEEAHQGTLFLDEIGDLSPSLQVKLLRVLQEGEVRPVGGLTSKTVDVRIIAATHRDLDALVRMGKFREDLLYRLKVIAIQLPPLRDRREDIPELLEHFVSRHSLKNAKAVSHIDPQALERLLEYSWPGNIRELEHAVERAIALAQSPVLYIQDFPSEIAQAGALSSATNSVFHGEDLLAVAERDEILRVLKAEGYNKSRASERLGIDRATLYRRAGKLGIDLNG